MKNLQNILPLLLLMALLFLMGATTPTSSTFPAPKLAEITASASPLDPRPYSLLITGSGTITVENRDGSDVDVAVLAGQEIHCQPYKITAISSATVIGMYQDDTE